MQQPSAAGVTAACYQADQLADKQARKQVFTLLSFARLQTGPGKAERTRFSSTCELLSSTSTLCIQKYVTLSLNEINQGFQPNLVLSTWQIGMFLELVEWKTFQVLYSITKMDKLMKCIGEMQCTQSNFRSAFVACTSDFTTRNLREVPITWPLKFKGSVQCQLLRLKPLRYVLPSFLSNITSIHIMSCLNCLLENASTCIVQMCEILSSCYYGQLQNKWTAVNL